MRVGLRTRVPKKGKNNKFVTKYWSPIEFINNHQWNLYSLAMGFMKQRNLSRVPLFNLFGTEPYNFVCVKFPRKTDREKRKVSFIWKPILQKPTANQKTKVFLKKLNQEQQIGKMNATLHKPFWIIKIPANKLSNAKKLFLQGLPWPQYTKGKGRNRDGF